MLKSEALMKWCPFSMVSSVWYDSAPQGGSVTLGGQVFAINPGNYSMRPTAAASQNRDGAGNILLPGTLCIAERCMAWQPTLGDDTRGHCTRLGYVS